ncbi:hypothetical protein FCV25MIE_21478 [Fagus crenata]
MELSWVRIVVTGLRVVAPTTDTSITLFAQTLCLNKPWPAIEIVHLAEIDDTVIVQLRCCSETSNSANLQNPKSILSKLHSNFIKTPKKLIKISQQAAQQQEDGTNGGADN